mmetsp:Transcript_10075/g.45647  ORF Transcript_10075/g.45647 Transcript_10075/m.45647 type:complete len:453 (-) Transcript_10075:786-2144(-)
MRRDVQPDRLDHRRVRRVDVRVTLNLAKQRAHLVLCRRQRVAERIRLDPEPLLRRLELVREVRLLALSALRLGELRVCDARRALGDAHLLRVRRVLPLQSLVRLFLILEESGERRELALGQVQRAPQLVRSGPQVHSFLLLLVVGLLGEVHAVLLSRRGEIRGEALNLLLQILEQRVFGHPLVDLGLVLDALGAVRVLERLERLLRRVRRRGHRGDDARLALAPERVAKEPGELRVPVRHVRPRVRQRVDAPPERLDRGVLRGAPAARRSLLAVDPGDVGDGNLRSRLRLRKPNPAPGGVKPPPRAPPGDPQREQTVHALARERPVRRGERRRGASRFANLALLGPETVGSERDEASAILRVFRDDLDAPFGVEAPSGVLTNVDADGGRRAVEDGRDGARAPAPSAAYIVLLARRFPRSFVFVVVAMGAAREFDSSRERVHEHLVRLPPRHR